MPEHKVLIIDSLGETGEVISTVLRKHGFHAQAVHGPHAGLACCRQASVTVVDLEGMPQARSWQEHFIRATGDVHAKLIVLGSTAHGPGDTRQVRFFDKPYRYAELIEAIEAACANGAENSDSAALPSTPLPATPSPAVASNGAPPRRAA